MAESSQQQQYPNLNPYSSSNGQGQDVGQQAQSAKNTVMSNAQSAMDSIQNSQTYQNIQNGPVADKARQEANQTQSEFSNLANARQTPETKTATGQPLTHYHSLFYTLLSWENPRATAISYVSIVLFIFATRYLPIMRYGLRLTWITLGCTAAAELAGRMVFDQGFASKLRPKQYWTISRENLDSVMADLEQLINFFVIEFQRILFAENVYATIGAFLSTLLTYFLIKITPAWGLALLFTTVLYFVPLIYITNKDLIDSHLENAGNIVSSQTQQVRDLASHHTNRLMEQSNATIKDYSTKAQEMMGSAKGKAVDQGVVSKETADKTEQSLKEAPSAPSSDPTGPANTQAETGSAEPVAAQ